MARRLRGRHVSERFALVGDVGGTNCRLGIMSSEGRLVERINNLDSRSLAPEELLENMEWLYANSKEYFNGTNSFVGVSIALAGLVSQKSGLMEASPHLGHYVGIPFLDMFRERFPGIHHMENDATAASLAEYRLGAGIGATNMVYVSVGTGIGGGLILNGNLYRGSGGFAGEIGHIYAGSEGLCACGKYGCLEATNSGLGIENQARDGLLSPRHNGLESDDWSVESQKIEGGAKSGDVASLELIKEIGKNIGVGLGSVVNVMNPDTLVIGGGLSELGEDLLNPIIASLRATAFHQMETDLRIRVSSLGDDGGMLGAGLLLFDMYSEP